eukprot:3160611-Rhodomonas_salina.1
MEDRSQPAEGNREDPGCLLPWQLWLPSTLQFPTGVLSRVLCQVAFLVLSCHYQQRSSLGEHPLLHTATNSSAIGTPG